MNCRWSFVNGLSRRRVNRSKVVIPSGLCLVSSLSFTNAQKCWAHLLRKANKLTLMRPDEEAYREFTDHPLEIYRKACRIQTDQRFSDEGCSAESVNRSDRFAMPR